ncbi:mitochondrial -transporting ATPase [Pyrrhoderma noxium]|uniref:Mitochondrial import inner membrane translocase subunit n=1 Tax=Pyrrhoderma noxium TaxID=2282107 RepID=A0A286UAL1_9AGAM|nr:mitochondrial -transporting ATPase [Pyrrhoderma noxium]
MSFFSSSSSSSTPASGTVAAADMQARKEKFMAQVRNELAVTGAQELINKINEKCYLKCVPKPGTSLSGSEQTCLSNCMDRYMEAFNVVSRTYASRLAREKQENVTF